MKNKKRASKLNATPGWANQKKINEFYETANGLSMLTGEWYSVDHVIPLISPLVCGLHCEQNLQILTVSDNSKKHNSYWPDMP